MAVGICLHQQQGILMTHTPDSTLDLLSRLLGKRTAKRVYRLDYDRPAA